MKLGYRFCIAVLAVGFAVVAPARVEARDIAVDCASPRGSIQQALGRFPGEPLRIEVRGTCEEHVVVERSNVAIVGMDAAAGIRSPASDHTGIPLQIKGAEEVSVSALTLKGGRWGLRIEDVGNRVFARDLVVTDNTGGIQVRRSVIILLDTEIVAEYTGISLENANVFCLTCQVQAGDIALLVHQHSTLHFSASSVDDLLGEGGGVYVESSVLDFRGSSTDNPIQADFGSTVLIRSSIVSAEGVLSVNGLSTAYVDAHSSVWVVMCLPSGEVVCDPAATVESSDDCAGCPANP